MPELPEIESLRRTLTPLIEGRRIDRVITRRRDLRFPLPRGFAQKLTGGRVFCLSRRGKYLLVEISTQHDAEKNVLLIHLGMSGRLVMTRQKPPLRHDHVIFQLGQNQLTFHDPRRFGFMDLFPSAACAHHPRLAILGPEPLSSAFTPKILTTRLATNSTIKAALLNQKIVAGLGNIYVCEALHAARLAPDRRANTLTLAECRRLHKAIQSQLKRAIKAGGATLRDYLNAKGQPGGFQHQFHVYARADSPCPACGQTIKRITQAARATFFCPSCQRRGKRSI